MSNEGFSVSAIEGRQKNETLESLRETLVELEKLPTVKVSRMIERGMISTEKGFKNLNEDRLRAILSHPDAVLFRAIQSIITAEEYPISS